MTNQKIIEQFYNSFVAGDAEGMVVCYADDIEFEDPAFGPLKGKDAKNMWRMLLKNPDINVSYSNVWADDKTGSADWVAVYKFSRTGRYVTNRVHAQFEFKDGKIVKHTDAFSFWKWASQAMGLPGYLLGWTPFLQNKVRAQALSLLSKFSSK